MSKLIAIVGINIADSRFEPGEEIKADLFTKGQIAHLLASGSAVEIERKGQEYTAEEPNPIADGMIPEEG